MVSTYRFFLILLLTAIIPACADTLSNSEDNSPLGEQVLPLTIFTIKGNVDTILTSQGGIQLYLPSNAFLDEKGAAYEKPVTIQLTEALSLEDMVKGNLTTLSNDSLILESSGMFKVEIVEKQVHLNPKAPIKVVLLKDIKANSSLYYGQTKPNTPINWISAQMVEKDSANYWLLKGRNLLHKHCISCHHVGLTLDMTGPPLAWATKRWDNFEDLASFTRNSTQFAESGNLRARYMIDWAASAMPSFSLTDEELRALYNYIDQECLVRGIDSTEFGQAPDTITYRNYIRAQDSSRAAQASTLVVLNGYYIMVNGVWCNIDRLMELENLSPVKLVVKVNNETYKGTSKVKLVFPERNILLQAFYNKQTNSYTFYKNTPDIRLPLQEKAYLIVTTTLEKEPSFALKELAISNSQVVELSLTKKKAQEIMTTIENLF